MTDQERSQILKMIEDGKISPEEGLHLMQVLDEAPAEELVPAPEAAPPPPSPETAGEPAPKVQVENSGFDSDPRIQKIKSTVRRFWQIPLWIGILITVLSAAGMYAVLRGPGLNFWFFFLLLPLLLGVLVIVLAVGSHKARWIFIDVQQKPGERPEHIFLGFPIPLGLTAWFLRTFGNRIPGLRDSEMKMDEVSQFLKTGFSSQEPFIVDVDEREGGDGERVKVYIG
jgi:hypothetical protein